jgi:protein-disulfide isomerase
MQKKPKVQVQEVRSSDWEKNLKKEAQKETLKKIGMWVGIAIASIAGLALLVFLAGRNGPTSEPVINENVRDVNTQEDIIVGNPNAPVALINYSDFQCPACADYNSTLKQIEAMYPEDVVIVYRIFPIDSIHKNAQISAQAAWAAWQMDKFIEMKDELYNNQSSWENLDNPEEEFIKYAGSIGLDEAEFEELMNSSEAEEFVNIQRAESISLGLNATPTFFLGKTRINARTFEDFKALIDAQLGNAESQSNSESAKPTLPPLQ